MVRSHEAQDLVYDPFTNAMVTPRRAEQIRMVFEAKAAMASLPASPPDTASSNPQEADDGLPRYYRPRLYAQAELPIAFNFN
ncbi:Hypothetical Protein FCC1311_057552 [Hondaea fermentalgiana]|uniref:Uncharacterized protein n=1 Tax=Hondaea fermentalgiana TaxID=2315210 RepID=A0A2R5GNT7_9STRA|nr:Hypothetical Protein FCC1311_057552 [Hondaea fermentalgiana]|eukprot:GBG29534.1 Hypothetical Protein FCC1311_057552 [Hondaea fermentalgiana]